MDSERERLPSAAVDAAEPAAEMRNVETTLEALRQRDSELRAALESSLADDERFQEFLGEAQQYLAKVGDANREGIERARALAALEAVLAELRETERGRLSGEFADVDRRRDDAQAQVEELRRMTE